MLEAIRNSDESFADSDGRVTELRVSHGVATGDVTATTAVIWARATHPATMRVEYRIDGAATLSQAAPVGATAATDHTAVARLAGLTPGSLYRYRVWFDRPPGSGGDQSVSVEGAFRTAPDAQTYAPVSFVFSGDLGGAGYCRPIAGGYAIFDVMRTLTPHFFVAQGDMIYADNECPSYGPDGTRNVPGGFPSVADGEVDWTNSARVRDAYLRHWRYNRADPAYQRFLASVPLISQWDDHEILNDSGHSWPTPGGAHMFRDGYQNLVAAGRDAFFSYAAIDRSPEDAYRVYRSFNWGRAMDLFVLDARSYRSRNDEADTPENRKTMLGPAQLEWLQRGLSDSKATWKVVAAEIPLSIPTGGIGAVALGRDGWARGEDSGPASQTGFRRELLELVRYLDDHTIRNVVFITGDVHQPVSLRYGTDPNGDGRPLVFHELIAGPLSASPGPRVDPNPDRILGPTVLYKETGFFNFGYVWVEAASDGKIHLLADVRGPDGAIRPGSSLDLAPE